MTFDKPLLQLHYKQLPAPHHSTNRLFRRLYGSSQADDVGSTVAGVGARTREATPRVELEHQGRGLGSLTGLDDQGTAGLR